MARERQGYCRGEPDLSGEYALDSARAEDSSTIDKPGDC